MAGNALFVGSFTNGSGGTSTPTGGDINLGGVSSAAGVRRRLAEIMSAFEKRRTTAE
jgi:hypothetical protein